MCATTGLSSSPPLRDFDATVRSRHRACDYALAHLLDIGGTPANPAVDSQVDLDPLHRADFKRDLRDEFE